MNIQDYFEIVENRGFFRPIAAVESFDEVETIINRAIEYARIQKIKELLVDSRHLSGFQPPSFMERFCLAERWAGTASGKLRLAMVARAEMIDAEKIGVTFAVNRGLDCDVFECEIEALSWLDRRHPR